MKHDKKYVIWSNWNLDIDGWDFSDLEEERGEELTDHEKWEEMIYLND